MLTQIKLSKGTAYLNKYTRKIKRKLTEKMFEGVGEISQSEELKIPTKNLLASSEYALELLLSKIVIDGNEKEFGYIDLDALEETDALTLEDISLIESKISETTNTSKKN
jgi:hypothetical protein